MSISHQVEILGKAKKLRPLPPEAVTAAAKPQTASAAVKTGVWISKQKALDLEPVSAPPPPPIAPAAAAVGKSDAREERKRPPEKSEDEIQVAADVPVDEPELDEGPPCGFCKRAPGKSHACCDCKQTFCFDCQNDHPEECLGDQIGPNKAWQCFGCLNSRPKPKRKLRDSCDELISRCEASEKEFAKELSGFSPIDAPTPTRRHDTYCRVSPDLPEEVLVYKEPLRENCQLPLCLFCVKHKNPTIFTIGSALGVAVPCGHAVACKECVVDFCVGKKNIKCPSTNCNSYMDSIVIIQNSVQPDRPKQPPRL